MSTKTNSGKSSYIKKNTQAESAYSERDTINKSTFSYSQILKDISKQSLKAIKWFFIIIFLTLIINILFISYNIIWINTYSNGLISVILALTIAFFSAFLAFSFTYRFIAVDTVGLVYKNLSPLFKKLCIKIIDVAVAGGNKISGKDINKSLNVGALMMEVYGNKAPKYLQKCLIFILDKIPFGNFLKQMQQDLSEKKDSTTLSEILYKYLDDYMNQTFKSNSINVVFIVLGINIVLQLLVIVFT